MSENVRVFGKNSIVWNQWNVLMSCQMRDAFNSFPLLFPTVINPFWIEKTLWQMGYFLCSCPPTSIAVTHPYCPGGHMCCTFPWSIADKGHGAPPASPSLVSTTVPNMAKYCCFWRQQTLYSWGEKNAYYAYMPETQSQVEFLKFTIL